MDIKIVRLPNNMDPDEYILKEGKSGFCSQLDAAYNLIDYKMELLKKKEITLGDLRNYNKRHPN